MEPRGFPRLFLFFLHVSLLVCVFLLPESSASITNSKSRASLSCQVLSPALLSSILPLSPSSVSSPSLSSRRPSSPSLFSKVWRPCFAAAASKKKPHEDASRSSRAWAPASVFMPSCAFVAAAFSSSFSPSRSCSSPLFATDVRSRHSPCRGRPFPLRDSATKSLAVASFLSASLSAGQSAGKASQTLHASASLPGTAEEAALSSPSPRLAAADGEEAKQAAKLEPANSEASSDRETACRGEQGKRLTDAALVSEEGKKRGSSEENARLDCDANGKTATQNAVCFGDAPFSSSPQEEEGDYWSDERSAPEERGREDVSEEAKKKRAETGEERDAQRSKNLSETQTGSMKRKEQEDRTAKEERFGETPDEDGETLTLLFPEEEEARQKTAVAAAAARAVAATTGKLFSSLHPKISTATVEALRARGITTMTPIQSESYEVLFEGRDVVARSETGSGKTIGFALPLMERERREMEKDFSRDSPAEDGNSSANDTSRDSGFYEQPRLLILEPTRELARQVAQEVERLGESLDLSSFCVYGGVPMESQLRQLRREKQRTAGRLLSPGTPDGASSSEKRLRKQAASGRLDVLIATPGRLLDLMGLNEGRETPQRDIDLSSVRRVVLDEADEMLKLGFAADVERILQKVKENPFNVQLILFSATTPGWVQDVAGTHLRNPTNIDILAERKLRTSTTVSHLAVRLPSLTPSASALPRSSSSGRGSSSAVAAAAPLLQDLILAESENGKQAIVFVPTKADADALANAADFERVGASVLHGDIGQETRQAVMEGFRRGRYKVLIATDVAARGIDVDSVDLVLHCGVPTDADTYIHRSGRTGRAGRAGKSLVLVSPQETADLERLERACGFKFSFIHLPSPNAILKSGAATASRLLDSISPSVLPFFRPAAEDVIRRGNLHGVSAVDIVARALAAAANMKALPQRSLLTGMAAQLTVLFANRRREWKSSNDVYYWIRVVAEDLGVELPPTLGDIRRSAADRR
ncbi:DEAD/DEAH box helicase domain-containing protein, partial [Toxoplasma gondii TgCatPRC2]